MRKTDIFNNPNSKHDTSISRRLYVVRVEFWLLTSLYIASESECCDLLKFIDIN